MSYVLKSAVNQLLVIEGSCLTIISDRGALDESGIREIPLKKIDTAKVRKPDGQMGYIRFYLKRAESASPSTGPRRQFSVKFWDSKAYETALKIQNQINTAPLHTEKSAAFITQTLQKWEKYREEGILSEIELRSRLKNLMAVNS